MDTNILIRLWINKIKKQKRKSNQWKVKVGSFRRSVTLARFIKQKVWDQEKLPIWRMRVNKEYYYFMIANLSI